MKFSQIADGQQFEYQGVTYTRSGPLMGVDSAGKSKMIPRSAEVKPVGQQSVENKPDLTKQLSIEQTLNIHQQVYSQCVKCITAQLADADTATLEVIRDCLNRASDQFSTALLD